MPGPAPKAASQRQRRNRHATAATLEAMPARRQPLPDVRWSSIKCQAPGCEWPSWWHTKRKFMEQEALAEALEIKPVAPHDFDPRPIPWRPTTVLWWDTIWASPMAEEWVDADVPGLLALAILMDEFWVSGDSKIHAEVRQAAREFGLSPFSRRQLQWEIKRLERVTPVVPPKPAGRPAAKGGGVLGILEGGKKPPAKRAAK
jgi:hypothetical protein